MEMSIYVRDLRHRIADIMGGVTGPQDYELDGAILASFEEVARAAERATLEKAAQVCDAHLDQFEYGSFTRAALGTVASDIRALAEPPP